MKYSRLAALSVSSMVAWSLAPNAGHAQPSTTTYTYDARGQLKTVQTGTGEKSSYGFDAAGNRTGAQVQKQFDVSWLATNLYHNTGYADPSGGWTADINSVAGAMVFGPYTNGVTVGNRTAVWRMLVDDSAYPATDTIATLDVFDASTGETLATKSLTWTSFAASWSYQIFELPFTFDAGRAGHSLEFRVWHTGKAHLNVERVGVY